jgi:hypothetical protein
MKKTLIYACALFCGVFFGFGVGWLGLCLIFVALGQFASTSLAALEEWSGGWLGYPILLILPLSALVGFFLSLGLATKIISSDGKLSSLRSRDKRKILIFISAGLVGFALLGFRIVKDS